MRLFLSLLLLLNINLLPLDGTWTAPTTNTNGKAVTNLAGYKIYVSQTGYFAYTTPHITICDPRRSYLSFNSLTNLLAGATYYAAITAYNTYGDESDFTPAKSFRMPTLTGVARLTAINDTNFNGLHDAWEMNTFHSMSHQATDDSDGDGYSDQLEYISGTDPNDPDDLPFMNIKRDNGKLKVSFKTKIASGAGYEGLTRYYTLFKSKDLLSMPWEAVSTLNHIPATGDEVSFEVDKLEDLGFFKVGISLE